MQTDLDAQAGQGAAGRGEEAVEPVPGHGAAPWRGNIGDGGLADRRQPDLVQAKGRGGAGVDLVEPHSEPPLAIVGQGIGGGPGIDAQDVVEGFRRRCGRCGAHFGGEHRALAPAGAGSGGGGADGAVVQIDLVEGHAAPFQGLADGILGRAEGEFAVAQFDAMGNPGQAPAAQTVEGVLQDDLASAQPVGLKGGEDAGQPPADNTNSGHF